MDSPQQREDHFPRSTTLAVEAPWNATAFLAPQHPQAAPPFHPRSVPTQPHGHAGVVRNAMFPPVNAARNHRAVQDWEHMPTPVEDNAAQGHLQDLRYVDMGHYDMLNDHPPLHHEHRGHAINNNYTGVALDVPVQAQAAPPVPIVIFDGPAQNAAAGPAPAFLGERPPEGPIPNGLANEILRQLAILYLHEPNSRVVMFRMEPGDAHRVSVFITIDLADLRGRHL